MKKLRLNLKGRICDIVDDKVSCRRIATDFEGKVKRELGSLPKSTNKIVVKIPIIRVAKKSTKSISK